MMGDNIKQLKKDHDEVKKKLKNLTKEFESLRDKMADKSDRASSPSSADVQHLSDTCDGFSTIIESFHTRLNKLASHWSRSCYKGYRRCNIL